MTGCPILSQLSKQAELYDITVLFTQACLCIDLATYIQAQHTPLWVRSKSSYDNLAGSNVIAMQTLFAPPVPFS